MHIACALMIMSINASLTYVFVTGYESLLPCRPYHCTFNPLRRSLQYNGIVERATLWPREIDDCRRRCCGMCCADVSLNVEVWNDQWTRLAGGSKDRPVAFAM